MKFDGRFALVLFIVSILCFLGFSHFNSKSAILKQDAIDISDTDMDKLKANMHVEMDVDMCLGYYLNSKRSSASSDTARNYLVLRYNNEIGKYDCLIDISVDSKEFEKWEKLTEDTLNNKGAVKPLHIEGYTAEMDLQHFKYYLSALGKYGLTSNYITNYYIVLINKKQINQYKFLTLSGGIIFIILGLLYLNWIYHPFDRDFKPEPNKEFKTECYDVELNEEDLKEENSEENDNSEKS
ncbi:MAG: hypothetical protein J6X97_02255 [Lachnospiraceae bacterium]|nr:hypothetical protein [Lachnospiraceae bacterium]